MEKRKTCISYPLLAIWNKDRRKKLTVKMDSGGQALAIPAIIHTARWQFAMKPESPMLRHWSHQEVHLHLHFVANQLLFCGAKESLVLVFHVKILANELQLT